MNTMGAHNDEYFEQAGETLEELAEELLRLRLQLESQSLRIRALELALKAKTAGPHPAASEDPILSAK